MDRLPKDFVAALKDHFDREVVAAVLRGLDEPASISVRLNQNKPSDRFNTERRVPWSDRGRLLEKRPSFSLDPLLHAGAYYVQDSSSMIIEYLLNQLSFDGGGILALDLCAAPGGKSINLSDFLEERGYLITNEVNQKRNSVLTENLLKWGRAHHAITQLSASKLGEISSVFDLVLIDVPCSGEGMFRKDAFTLEQWNLDLVTQCANTQSQILNDIDSAIRPGGYVVYSTCTMNIQENEWQVKYMLELGYELVSMDMSEFAHYIIPAVYENENLGWYLLPGISSGEGLFVSVLRKRSEASFSPVGGGFELSEFESQIEIPEGIFNYQWTKKEVKYGTLDRFGLLNRLPEQMAFKSVGMPAFEMKCDRQIPKHGLAMSNQFNIDIELSEKQALDYLRCQSINMDTSNLPSWCIVGFEETPLGWAKAVPRRLNNHYPKPYKLRQQ
mgnify:CR=1 FL=1